ncbi:MAG: FtsX-like permease family protein [bacterium]
MIKFERFIAGRYLNTSIINKIATIVVAIGCFLMVFVLSIMNGFEYEVKDRIVGHNAHILIRKYHNKLISGYDSIVEKIQQVEHVEGVSPVIMEKIGIDSREVQEAAMCIGLDSAYAVKTTRINEYLKWGSLHLDSIEAEPGDSSGKIRKYPGVVLGVGLANKLRVVVGDIVFLLSFKKQDDVYSSIIPRVKRFVVCALYESGYNEYDANFAMIGLKQAQDLFMFGDQVNTIQVKVNDMYKAPQIAERVKNALGSESYKYYVTHWMAINSMLFKWIKLEKLIMFLILSAYIFLAALSIISSLITIVIEKTREIGILKSMGAKDSSLISIFISQGFMIGIRGTFWGLLFSIVPCLIQQHTHAVPIPSDIYFMNYVPIIVNIWDILAIIVSINILCGLATIIPAYKAARLVVVEALRYE